MGAAHWYGFVRVDYIIACVRNKAYKYIPKSDAERCYSVQSVVGSVIINDLFRVAPVHMDFCPATPPRNGGWFVGGVRRRRG